MRNRTKLVMVALMVAALGMAGGPAEATIGGRTGEFNGDARGDILARDRVTGDLKVYLHTRFYQGTATYHPPEVINHNWQSMRWIGTGRLSLPRTSDGLSDVIAIRKDNGQLLHYPHSGAFGTPGELLPPTVIGYNWHINDLVFVSDVDEDGADDLVARRKGTGDVYVYHNRALTTNGPVFDPPRLLASGYARAVWLGMADIVVDGRIRDLVFIRDDGVLGMFSFQDNKTYWLGTGWQTIDAVVLTDIDADRDQDLLGRRKADGVLQVYQRRMWDPQPDGTAYGTFLAPETVGFGWQRNDIIT